MEKLKTISDIGVKMRSIRKSQHVSQETLAGLAGTGARYISELERGKETIRTRELLKLLDALGAGLYILTPKEVAEWKRSTSI
ncbi:MAG: helix-turn-helix domain-containing protein [Kiritimatiellae bacterium]|jgi:transcriptional regulator with XRE-family HTH domain|nr:helix-turn-helix domain-containing protein [Kiritimatiellia bacterium]